MSREQRVVLIKPGDVLLIGNLGDFGESDDLEAVGIAAKTLRDVVGVKVALFAADIDIAALADPETETDRSEDEHG